MQFINIFSSRITVFTQLMKHSFSNNLNADDSCVNFNFELMKKGLSGAACINKHCVCVS